MKCIILNFESGEVDILEDIKDGLQIEEVEKILISRGYKLGSIEFMFNKEIKINYI